MLNVKLLVSGPVTVTVPLTGVEFKLSTPTLFEKPDSYVIEMVLGGIACSNALGLPAKNSMKPFAVADTV